MDMTGEYHIPAPRQRVWEGLNDPAILKDCIPGCQEIEKVSDTEFAAKVVAKVGPVKAAFGGKVTLSDLAPPQGYTIAGEGTGGVAGFAKGSARVDLVEEAGGTLLKYTAQANVGGKLAQIGSRLIGATARKMADDFFGRFAGLVAAGAAGAGETGGEGGAPLTGGSGEAEPQNRGPGISAASGAAARELRLSPAVWVGGLTAVVALMLYVFAVRGLIR
ncbi:MAG: SRPBCC family protein [Stellaceae bacterium]